MPRVRQPETAQNGAKEMTAVWLARTLTATLPATLSENTRFSSITTDSRKAGPGSVFVALKGDQFDGHQFISSAIEKGAAAILCQKGRTPSQAAAWIIEVDDPLQAYYRLGAAWRSKFSIPIVLVAGSSGKTTTKELLAAALSGRFPKLLKTTGSQNGWIGIPMTLLELRPDHQAAVIEVGIDEPGAMLQHVRALRPSVAVLTAIGPEHLEKLGDLETIAREEGIALTETAALGGAVAIQCDDPWISRLDAAVRENKLGYTLGERKDPAWITGTFKGTFKGIFDGNALSVESPKWKKQELFTVPLPGRHNAVNLLSTITVAHLLGLAPEEIREGLLRFQAPEGRSQIRTVRGVQVLCDYYNSQPASLHAGLTLLAELAKPSERWACLADMLELGSGEERFHREVARWITELSISHVVLYGPRMKWLEAELRTMGYAGFLTHCATQADAAELLIDRCKKGALLIKGSHSMKMEEVWKLFHRGSP